MFTDTGGTTKAFSTLNELAMHIYGRYGCNWPKFIRRRTIATGELAKQYSVEKSAAPDLFGNFPAIGRVVYNGKLYTVYDAPADGSCMYHAISAVCRPILKEATPSAGTFKQGLVKFYMMDNAIKRKMEETFNISFKDRLRDVQSPSHWGEYTDVFALSTIYNISFNLAICGSTENLKIKSML